MQFPQLLHRIRACIEVDAVDGSVPGHADVVPHCIGVRNDLLFHDLLFHYGKFVHVIIRSHLDPGLFIILFQYDGRSFVEVIVEYHLSADLLQCILNVPAYFQFARLGSSFVQPVEEVVLVPFNADRLFIPADKILSGEIGDPCIPL